MIRISKHDEVYIRIDTDESILRRISDKYTFFANGYKWNPSYKNGYWDGKIRLVDMRRGLLYRGLLESLVDFLVGVGYTNIHVSSDLRINNHIETSSIENEMKTFSDKSPRDYQINGVTEALKRKRLFLLSATGSGKSFILYSYIRMMDKINPDMKILFIVPNVSLVDQMYNDFVEYDHDASWNVGQRIHKIYQGLEKDTHKNIIISTWQSLQNKPEEFFKKFGCVIVDEGHTAKGKSLVKILEACVNAEYRLATSGTLDGTEINEMTLVGLFGSLHTVSTTSELMDAGTLADLSIKVINLTYEDSLTKDFPDSKNFLEESVFINQIQGRNDFIVSLVSKLGGNSLVLVSHVDTHAYPLFQKMKKLKKKVFLITGETKPEDREYCRRYTEKNDNVVIISTYSLFSTGINIVNLHNAIFGASLKSKIKILQSIGRVLRKSNDKTKALVVDLVDLIKVYNVKNNSEYTNMSFFHGFERYKLYKTQGFDTSKMSIVIKDGTPKD